MRRRPGNMRHAASAGADQKILDRLAIAAQRQRAQAGDRAQENLQAAITADVVERRPILHRGLRRVRRDRAGQRRQRMDDHFRVARGSRCQQHPFGRVTAERLSRARLQWQRAGREKRNGRDLRRLALPAIDDGIGFGVADDGAQMPGLEIGRAENDAARPTVELDQRGGGLQLVARHQDDRTAFECAKIAAKTGLAGEIVKNEGAVRHADGAADADAGRKQFRQRQKLRLRHVRTTRSTRQSYWGM
jgi:hypothetical protein